MFERAAIFSAVFALTSFYFASIRLLQFTGLKAESPIAVIKEMLPFVNATNTTDKTDKTKTAISIKGIRD
jgi:hypothetical protein